MTCSAMQGDRCECVPEGVGCLCEAEGGCRGSEPCVCMGYGPRLEGLVIPCLLMFLRQRPSHGYELYVRLSDLPFLRVLPDPGVIYRQLRRMKSDGLVESSLEPSRGGPARTVYSLTGEGEEYLMSCIVNLKGIKCSIENFFAALPRYGAAGTERQAGSG